MSSVKHASLARVSIGSTVTLCCPELGNLGVSVRSTETQGGKRKLGLSFSAVSLSFCGQ
jgi:hypothetical protein